MSPNDFKLGNFHLEKHKIEKIKFQEIFNDNIYNSQKEINKKIRKNFEELKSTESIFKNIYILSTGIKTPNAYLSGQIDSHGQPYYNYVFEYDYKFDNVPKEMLPYIECKIIYHIDEDKWGGNNLIFFGGHWIEILYEDIINKNYNIIIHASYISEGEAEDISHYQGEIIVFISNPYRFI